jgi:hypothetical protein
MKYLKESFIGKRNTKHTQDIKKGALTQSSAVHSCSKEWKDLVGFRDEEMRNKRFPTRSIHGNGALSSFLNPEEKPPLWNELLTPKKGIIKECLSSSFIYDLWCNKSRKTGKDNRSRKSHNGQLFNY